MEDQYWEGLHKKLALYTQQITDGHVLWNGSVVKGVGMPVAMKYKGKEKRPHQWMHMLRHKLTELPAKSNIRRLHSCTNKLCVSALCWVLVHKDANNNKDSDYAFVRSYLEHNSKQEGECKIWTGRKSPYGVGVARFKNKQTYAHILAYQMKTNTLSIKTPNCCIFRSCCNLLCIEPTHLSLETREEHGIKKRKYEVEHYKPKKKPKTITSEMYSKVLSRIEKRSTKVADTAHDSPHWIFPLYKSKFYGQIGFNGKSEQTHRLAFVAFHQKEIPIGMETRHMCKEKACCNPAHLAIGTRIENMHDRHAQGTHYETETHPNATMTNETAIQIKTSKGDGTQADRAIRFNVSFSVVQSIDNCIAWKSLFAN